MQFSFDLICIKMAKQQGKYVLDFRYSVSRLFMIKMSVSPSLKVQPIKSLTYSSMKTFKEFHSVADDHNK